MSKIFLFALPILLITGCKSKIKPIPPREMEHVLLDINIAETYSSIIKDSLHKDMSKNMDSLAEYYPTATRGEPCVLQSESGRVGFCLRTGIAKGDCHSKQIEIAQFVIN